MGTWTTRALLEKERKEIEKVSSASVVLGTQIRQSVDQLSSQFGKLVVKWEAANPQAKNRQSECTELLRRVSETESELTSLLTENTKSRQSIAKQIDDTPKKDRESLLGLYTQFREISERELYVFRPIQLAALSHYRGAVSQFEAFVETI